MSRGFSIFLLCPGFDDSNSLEASSKLKAEAEADGLPAGASLFILDGGPYSPWWRAYFGIRREILQASKGAIVFMPIDDRWLALCFGHVTSNLRDDCYEYDFGIRATLNCVDPKKLRNTDVAEPGAARRRRTQLAVGSDLTLFDIDRDSTVLRSLTGKVKDEFSHIIGQATGATNLRVQSSAGPAQLEKLGRQVIEIYKLEDYRTTFADIQNVVPVRDPQVLSLLGEQLLDAIRGKSEELLLAIPEMVDYSNGFRASFAGVGASKIYDDITMQGYFEYLDDHQVDLAGLTQDGLKRHRLGIVDADGETVCSYSIFRSILVEAVLPSKTGVVYHLSEGHWYRVDKEYLRVLTAYLDDRYADPQLPACALQTEGAYNRATAEADAAMVCLDATNISPSRQRQVEPCDIYTVRDGRARMVHVKISTNVRELSHLFNQGSNSVELLKSEHEAGDKLRALINDKCPVEVAASLCEPISRQAFEVTYAIITHKPSVKKSSNLPLFSRISLRRNIKSLELWNAVVKFGFVDDEYARSTRRNRPRNPRKRRTAD